MKRRQMLVMGAAVIAVPYAPAVASTTPAIDLMPIFEKIDKLDAAIAAVRSFGLSPQENALVFGFEPNAPYISGTPNGLQTLVYRFGLDYDSRDLWARVGFIDKIQQGLDARFPGDARHVERKVWINRAMVIPGYSLRHMMTKNWASIEYASISIRHII